MTTLCTKDSSVKLDLATLTDDRLLAIFRALLTTAPAMQGEAVMVTSVKDGRHSTHSRHYIGLAVDVRTYGTRLGAIAPDNAVPSQVELAEAWVLRLKQFLGPDYDVVLERDHIHVEWDQKA